MTKNVFINISNHPSSLWGEKQRKEAEKFGDITDIPFPAIPSDAPEKYIDEKVREYYEKITEYSPECVMCEGEFTFTYGLVTKLRDDGIKVVAACSEREVEEYTDTDGVSQKNTIFKFVRFREYK